MIYKNETTSQVFGGADMVMEGTLKNPNQYRDAVLFESLNSMPNSKIKEFANSEEAKVMVNENMISADVIDRLCENNKIMDITVCHIAKENSDPLWEQLVACRVQERRIMNEMIEKYSEEAKPVAESANKNFVQKYIPEYFRG